MKKLEAKCPRCAGRGWVKVAGEDWPIHCPMCGAKTEFTMRQLAKLLDVDRGLIRRVLEWKKGAKSVRPSSAQKLLERIAFAAPEFL